LYRTFNFAWRRPPPTAYFRVLLPARAIEPTLRTVRTGNTTQDSHRIRAQQRQLSRRMRTRMHPEVSLEDEWRCSPGLQALLHFLKHWIFWIKAIWLILCVLETRRKTQLTTSNLPTHALAVISSLLLSGRLIHLSLPALLLDMFWILNHQYDHHHCLLHTCIRTVQVWYSSLSRQEKGFTRRGFVPCRMPHENCV